MFSRVVPKAALATPISRYSRKVRRVGLISAHNTSTGVFTDLNITLRHSNAAVTR